MRNRGGARVVGIARRASTRSAQSLSPFHLGRIPTTPLPPKRGRSEGFWNRCLAAATARIAIGVFASLAAELHAGTVSPELRPPTQTQFIGSNVDISMYAVANGGVNQTIGYYGVIVQWDPSALSLVGKVDNGPFMWSYSGFPADSGHVNDTWTDGTAYYSSIVSLGGPLATATPAGLLVSTLRFTVLPPYTGATDVSFVVCESSTCTIILDKHPFSAGVQNIIGALGGPSTVERRCNAAGQCDDANACTDDSCNGSQLCLHVNDDTNNPNDGLFCNGLETGCSSGQVIIQPGSIPNCNDNVSCTTDSCNEATDQCDHIIAPATCVIGGTCYAGGAINPANECQICQPSNSTTAWTSRPAGTACGNPNFNECDGADTCNASGGCLTNLSPVGTACGDATDGPCTDPDTCDGAGQCLQHNVPNGTTCNDNLWCTPADVCENGACLGIGNQCPGLVCDESADLCEAVNLEWRQVTPVPTAVGYTVDVSLYAVSATGVDQGMSSLSVILNWDPTRLQLQSHIDDGPYSWFSSAFPDDSGLGGLNNTFTDGDALYQALSRLSPSPPAIATAAGLKITTFRFLALAPLPGQVRFNILQGVTRTKILDFDPTGLDITGTLGPPANITIVECFVAADCDDGEFCNGVELCSGNECLPGTPPNCDDGVFCNGEETCEPGVGCVSPGNPCPLPATCDEGDESCAGCKRPAAVAEGCRYIRITPQTGTTAFALRVTGDDTTNDFACLSAYVHPDGKLGVAPVLRTSSEWGVLELRGCSIQPDQTYYIQADCTHLMPGLLSPVRTVHTGHWADVTGDGQVTIIDLVRIIDASNGNFNGIPLQVLDVAPCTPDGIINSQDVNEATSSLNHAGFGCPKPCPPGGPTGDCNPSIPTVNVWGLIGLGLLVATAASVRLRGPSVRCAR